LSLGARTRFYVPVAQGAAVWTSAIPLGEAAPGCGAEDSYAHSGTFTKGPLSGGQDRLELGVGVRANFAIEVDFFVLRRNPFHGEGSFWSQNAYQPKNNNMESS
jgi:hypothetical protein